MIGGKLAHWEKSLAAGPVKTVRNDIESLGPPDDGAGLDAVKTGRCATLAAHGGDTDEMRALSGVNADMAASACTAGGAPGTAAVGPRRGWPRRLLDALGCRQRRRQLRGAPAIAG